MEISEEQRKQAIINARRAKLGKSKSEPATSSLSTLQIFKQGHIFLFESLTQLFLHSAHRHLPGATFSGGVSQHQQSLHPLHQRHVTIPTSVPQQQVFALAEPPKRKPYDMLYTFTRNAFFRKWGLWPPTPLTFHFFCMCVQSARCPEDLETLYICMFMCVCAFQFANALSAFSCRLSVVVTFTFSAFKNFYFFLKGAWLQC